ncbi:MAG TPA: hypothetical protein GXX57_04420 [Firmicutes bacterium]|jgi:hypothetical protein|nr:hypothetical protein [Bacillota bacterium]
MGVDVVRKRHIDRSCFKDLFRDPKHVLDLPQTATGFNKFAVRHIQFTGDNGTFDYFLDDDPASTIVFSDLLLLLEDDNVDTLTLILTKLEFKVVSVV